jgi:hypothetical protein
MKTGAEEPAAPSEEPRSLGLSDLLSQEARSDIMPTIHSELVLGHLFPEEDALVRMGYNREKKTAWLELTNTPSAVMNGSKEAGVRRYLIGAVNKPDKGWQPIQPVDVTGGEFVSLSSNFSRFREIGKVVVRV